MTVFYLVIAILLKSGVPEDTALQHFDSVEACEDAGLMQAKEVVARADVDHAAWQCLSIDFALVDPLPDAPPELRKSAI